jgi:hypothetical protein
MFGSVKTNVGRDDLQSLACGPDADILSASVQGTLRFAVILNPEWFALRAQADRMSALRPMS